GLALVAGLHPATAVLATAPGGIAEMAITAKVLQLGVPVVTAFQVLRYVAVLTLTPLLFKRGPGSGTTPAG
ncbi:MAG: AbrB family transcriptional regulator, partial [Rubrivivax sp.]